MELHALVIRYVAHRQASGRLCAKAARGVRYKLTDFADGTTAAPANINRRHVETWLERPDLAPSYNRQRLSALRGFCEWCVLNGHMRRDPTLGVQGPRVPKAAPRRLTTSHARTVARHAPDARGRVIVLLQLQEGLRCCEVARAELGDVDLVRAHMGVRGKGGNGGITRSVPLSDETVMAIERYLDEYPAVAGPLVRSYHLTHAGISAAHVSELVGRWMYDAGVKQRPHDGKAAHSLRHTMASDMAERGETEREIQHALGHANLATSGVYTAGVTPDLRRAMAGRSYLVDA